MKKLKMILPLMFLLCFTMSCQSGKDAAEEPAVDIEKETQALRQAVIEWCKAGPAQDVEILMSYIADDVDLVFSKLLDKAQMRENYAKRFTRGDSWINQPPAKVVVSASGDLAYTIAAYEYHRAGEGETRTSEGYNLVVWRKQADGRWKVVALK